MQVVGVAVMRQGCRGEGHGHGSLVRGWDMRGAPTACPYAGLWFSFCRREVYGSGFRIQGVGGLERPCTGCRVMAQGHGSGLVGVRIMVQGSGLGG